MELVKKTVALSLIEHQVASSKIAKGWGIKHRAALQSLAPASYAEAFELSIRLDRDDEIFCSQIIPQCPLGGVCASDVDFRLRDLTDRALCIEVEFAEGIDFQIEPLQSHWTLLLPGKDIQNPAAPCILPARRHLRRRDVA